VTIFGYSTVKIPYPYPKQIIMMKKKSKKHIAVHKLSPHTQSAHRYT